MFGIPIAGSWNGKERHAALWMVSRECITVSTCLNADWVKYSLNLCDILSEFKHIKYLFVSIYFAIFEMLCSTEWLNMRDISNMTM